MFLAYFAAWLIDDPHLSARTLRNEIEDLGYAMLYQMLTRKIRELSLRAICPPYLTATERSNAIIDRPPGEENDGIGSICRTCPPRGWGPAARLFD